MKVAHLIDSLKSGGAQKLLVTFARQAGDQDSGQPVSVTVISLRADTSSPVGAELSQAGANVVAIPGRGLLDVLRFWRLVGYLRQEKFAVMQAHLTYANILAGVAGWMAGTPVIGTLHNAEWDPRHTRTERRWLEYWILRNHAQRVVAVGKAVAAAHQDRLKGKNLVVIANAASQPAIISEAERAALRRELGGGSRGALLISVGRLSPQKGYADLLEAFSMVVKRLPETRLVIAGDGKLFTELQSRIDSLGLQQSVRLLGNRQDVPRLLPACDLYVSAALFEGLPVAVLEAMHAGLAVVATQVGELPEVVTPGTGLLVPSQQPEQLARAVLTLLEEPARRAKYARAARAHAEAHFSARKWYETYLNLYQSVIQGN